MNSYYGVKDQEYNTSFIEAKWLVPYEVLQKLQLKPNMSLPQYLNSTTPPKLPPLIYPNELIYSTSYSDSKQRQLVDVILIAKYSPSSSACVRLKSVLLSQLLATPTPAPSLLILSLPRDTYCWSKVANVNLIPSNALRVGFDSIARQFAYIGRLKLDNSILSSYQQQQLQQQWPFQQSSLVFGYNNNLFGSLINVYEYIPAILMQLNDISSLNHNWNGLNSEQSTSMWSRLRQTASNRLPSFVVSSLSSTSTSQHHQPHSRQHMVPSIDFNLTTTNYEVLCLRKQPGKLKQLAAHELVRLDDENERYAQAIRSLSISIRSLVVPSYLVPGQCVIKEAKMRSANHVYELGVNAYGALRFAKRENVGYGYGERQVATVEKNVESLLVIKTGVYVIFDSNLTTRRPLVLYQHHSAFRTDCSPSPSSFYLEITNDGFLRVTNSNRMSIDLFNMNEYFQPAAYRSQQQQSSVVSLGTSGTGSSGAEQEKQILLNNQKLVVRQESLININLRLILDDLRHLPARIINIVLTVIKSFVETVLYRRTRVSRRAL